MKPQNLLCPNLPLFLKGKVREVYDFDDKLLMVATDQISAFDVVLPSLIPGKGALLTQVSNFWFDHFSDVENHILATNVADYPEACKEYAEILEGRSVLVKKCEMIQLEAIVRGYLSGSGFKDYQKTGAVCGIKLPEGLTNSAKLEEPIFTPSTKAHEGHDINVSEEEIKKIVDPALVDKVKSIALHLYTKAAEYALTRGIIIADTKFEFGLLDGKVILIDEILTPDSSRFWPADDYRVGEDQKSYDKQIIRDYLLTLDWDKTYPGPALPQDIIDKSLGKYQEVYNKLKA
ncbi:MAG: phosphoribosylaminoimidazolesuccinocarboxamide synthase [SAR324 cluster bacterium]|nr:phosphoribosylaminoimidazolesuccinocarboxamide synthase [SAR324 cluster bacterium]